MIFGRVMRTLLLTAMLYSAPHWFSENRANATELKEDQHSAVIFSYHRIGEDQYPETNLRLSQFQDHIRELKSGAYTVKSLPDIIAAFKNNTKLPPRTVGLSFDGIHLSAIRQAAPLLLDAGLPFTVFLPTGQIDTNNDTNVRWADLRRLQNNELVSFGLQPDPYARMLNRSPAAIRGAINKAKVKVREELGLRPGLFAYPFGEYNQTYRTIIRDLGFNAAFGQQSGAAYMGHDLFSLPRFTMTESYGSLERFRLTAHALPLPVNDFSPENTVLTSVEPNIGFTLPDKLKEKKDNLSCFLSGQGALETLSVGAKRIEIRLSGPLTQDRVRMNCTLPVDQEAASPLNVMRWRWYGRLFAIPENRISNRWSSDIRD